MTKAIPLQYGEQKKRIFIDSGSSIDEYNNLIDQAKTKIPELDNPICKLVLQRFEKDWEEWIDFEENESMHDRDRMKVVLIAQLSSICQACVLGVL